MAVVQVQRGCIHYVTRPCVVTHIGKDHPFLQVVESAVVVKGDLVVEV